MKRTFAGTVGKAALFAGIGLCALGSVILHTERVANAQGTTSIMLDVDAPVGGSTVANGQRFFIGGWAAVQGSTQGSGITSVEIFLDNPQGGNRLGAARLGVERPDVARTFGQAQWGTSGFNFDWVPRDVAQGPHTIYIVARSASGDVTQQSVQVSGCGCSNAGSFTNPRVNNISQVGYELDTGGPGVFLERRPDDPPGGR